MEKVVAMTAIPGKIRRGASIRRSLAHGRYAELTWRWWCERHDVRFVILNRPIGGTAYREMPPTLQRWLAPRRLIGKYGPGTQVAMVDADTMIRWDAPDIFEAAGSRLSAVQTGNVRWISHSIKAHQHFFPGIELPWWEYFNAGVVVVSEPQLRVLDALNCFVNEHWPELQSLDRSKDVGTDQTLINFIARREGEPVHFIAPAFNLLHCVRLTQLLWDYETNPGPEQRRRALASLSEPGALDFVDLGYIWHFTNVIRSRSLVMGETWRRIRSHYPGASAIRGGARRS